MKDGTKRFSHLAHALKVHRGCRGGACRWTRLPVERLGWFLERAFRSGVERIAIAGEEDDRRGRVLDRRPVACGESGSAATPQRLAAR
jgi:hypothetical protein